MTIELGLMLGDVVIWLEGGLQAQHGAGVAAAKWLHRS